MILAAMTISEMRRIWLQPLVWIILGVTFIIMTLLFLVSTEQLLRRHSSKICGGRQCSRSH